MSNGAHHRRGFELPAKAANALKLRDWTITQIDPEGLRYVASIQAWLHWALGVLETGPESPGWVGGFGQ